MAPSQTTQGPIKGPSRGAFRGAFRGSPSRASKGLSRESILDDLAARVVLAGGWRRALLALAAGVLASLAMPPLNAAPVLLVAYPVLVWLIDGAAGEGAVARLRSAAWVGWLFGLGFFAASLHWITNAFLVEAETFGWAAPLAVPLLAAGLGLFTAAGCALARLLWSDGAWRVAAFASGLGLSEWARGHVFTGFPWNTPGMALGVWEAPSQGAALVGLHGLGFLALFVFAAPAALALGAGRRRARRAPLLLAGLVLALLWGGGAWRLAAPPFPKAGPVLRLVHPAIDQREKWRPGGGGAVLDTYLTLSRQGPAGPATPDDVSTLGLVDAVIWPESAFPFVLMETPQALSAITSALPDGTVLLTGALRLDRTANPGERADAYNSLLALDRTGVIAAADKTHLVPFGEYLPFQDALEALGLQQLTRLRGGFTPGAERRTLRVPGLPAFQPLICYEAIFPGALFGPSATGTGPAWLLNVTNDAWFGRGAGPAQHLAHARLRAVEEGLPFVRVANSGVSAAFDGLGRTLVRLETGTPGAADVALPEPANAPLFSRLRWLAPLLLAGLMMAGALIGRWNR